MLPRRISTNSAPTPIGARNAKIDILKLARRDGSGNPVWDVFAANLWAKIQLLTSTYKEKTQQVTSEATHRVSILYLPGVTSAMRIRSAGAIYEIEGQPSDPDGLQRELVINVYCRNDGATGVQP